MHSYEDVRKDDTVIIDGIPKLVMHIDQEHKYYWIAKNSIEVAQRITREKHGHLVATKQIVVVKPDVYYEGELIA